ncbi:MAG TPA: translation initiation factor IF-3 [Solirubrobacteraceae bacterium]|nr:translation initiation factor IF-3 [Solirubrobacteraceae bacterium]
MPVPRRFDRRPPERDQTRTNERIRVPEVRLVGEDGKQIGVIKTSEALAYAQERDLDLVEVAPDARPPVCRVLDYSKYKYEQAQKQKQARKHQQQITIREIKFRPKIAQNDYDTKKGHVQRFLKGKDRVKVTIMFRGREVTHPERGTALLEKLAEELSELAVVEQRPIQDGRNMTMMLAPSKAVLSGEIGGSGGGETGEGDGNAAAEQKPAASEQKPSGSEEKPSASAQKPSSSEKEPAAAEQATAPVDKSETGAAAAPDAEKSPNGTAKSGSGRASKKDAAPSGDGAGEPESAPADAPA